MLLQRLVAMHPDGDTDGPAQYRDRPIAHVARELGIHPEVLRSWIRRDQADQGERTDLATTAEREELQRLRKRVVELERANAILKAASAYFAQELDPTRRRS
jgi:transposase